MFNGECRVENVIYKAKWKPNNEYYIGKTQVDLKSRIYLIISTKLNFSEKAGRTFQKAQS
jgi:hypothetical protein